MTRYEIDFSKSLEIEKKMRLIPDKAEKLVNDVLKQKGTRIMMDSIIEEMPRSSKRKKHAKDSKPLTYRMMNLGFLVVAKGGAANKPNSFGYLVFPDEGRGPHNPIKQQFFKRGGDKANEPIQDEVIEALEKAHEDLA